MTWQDAWRERRTPWDAGASPPVLARLVHAGTLPDGLAVVPGCGAGYDVLSLASASRPVIGIDVAEGAGDRFEALRTERKIPADWARIHIGDFFAFDPGEPVQLVWDYTFFCALDPEVRPRWGERIDALLGDEGELVTLMFPTASFGSPSGPPYTVDVDMYQGALGRGFTPTLVEHVEESHPGRQGLEVLARWRRR
jgi:phytoene dehydrogenase-like protein